MSFRLLIWFIRSLASFVVMLAAITALLTPQARPSAVLLGTYTYGTFYSMILALSTEKENFKSTNLVLAKKRKM